MLLSIVTHQVLYVLHLQFDTLSLAYRQAYGIHSYHYSITGTTLSFSFWNEASRNRSYDVSTDESDINRIELFLATSDGFPCIRGRCSAHEFVLDLCSFRLLDVLYEVGVVNAYSAVHSLSPA